MKEETTNPEKLLSPKTSVIIRQHGKIPVILDSPVVLDYGPAYQDYNNRIIKTLQQIFADGRKREMPLILLRFCVLLHYRRP